VHLLAYLVELNLKLRHPLHLNVQLLVNIVDLLAQAGEQASAFAGQHGSLTVWARRSPVPLWSTLAGLAAESNDTFGAG
jgi:hypothetical protein